MNISNAGLFSSSGRDIVNVQLSSIASASGFQPPSKTQKSLHETDKQAEDNATWVFEYRALLNSKLTTLVTALTSAYTTDLDSAMGRNDSGGFATVFPWGGKPAMQGITGDISNGTQPKVDPGAARTTFGYLASFGQITTAYTNPNSTLWYGSGAAGAAEGQSFAITHSYTQPPPVPVTPPVIPIPITPAATAIPFGSGTTTFISSGSSIMLDELAVDFTDTTQNRYLSTKHNAFIDNIEDIDDIIRASNKGPRFTNTSNNLERSLIKFFQRPENLDILRFGLFKDVYVVGTSSLPTGSQVQGSISLNWNQSVGRVGISQERFACFYHT